MTTSMSEAERKMRKNNESVLVRVCPEFHNLIKDVQTKTYVRTDAQATKVIYDQMIFDANLAGIFQRRKKV